MFPVWLLEMFTSWRFIDTGSTCLNWSNGTLFTRTLFYLWAVCWTTRGTLGWRSSVCWRLNPDKMGSWILSTCFVSCLFNDSRDWVDWSDFIPNSLISYVFWGNLLNSKVYSSNFYLIAKFYEHKIKSKTNFCIINFIF